MKKLIHNRIIMIGIVAALLFTAFSTTAYGAETDNITELQAQGEIISDVNVREGPGTDYDKIGIIREGETVTVTGKSHDGWYRIEYEGEDGFIYGQYVSVQEAEPEETGGQEEGELDVENAETAGTGEEEEDISPGSSMGILKPAAVIVIIALIIIMIFLTIRSLRQSDEGEDEEDYDDDEEYEDEEDEYEDEDDDGEYDEADGEDDGGEYDGEDDGEEEAEEVIVPPSLKPEQTIIIREEDYQLHIDPKYFEDEPVTQPEYVTGYLKKKQEEEAQEAEAGEKKENSGELQKAMDKLQELQEEIEKLKNKQ